MGSSCEAFRSDRQDKEIEPPSGNRRGEAADQPLKGSGNPTRRADRQSDHEQRELPNGKRGRRGNDNSACDRKGDGANSRRADEKRHGPDGREQGGCINPGAVVRYGAFQTDNGAKKAADHEGAVQDNKRLAMARQLNAQADQPGIEPNRHRQHTGRQEYDAQPMPGGASARRARIGLVN